MTPTVQNNDEALKNLDVKAARTPPAAADGGATSASPKKRRKVNHGMNHSLHVSDFPSGCIRLIIARICSLCILSTLGEPQLS